MDNLIESGVIVGTHGVRGEIRVEPWCDGPEFLLQFKTVYLAGKPYPVEAARVHKSLALLKLRGVDDVQTAQALRGREVWIDRTGVVLPEGRYFVRDLTGLSVVDADGVRVGTLYEVMSLPAHDVYRVQGEDGERYIPATPQFVKEIDLSAGIVRVELIEGM